MGNTLTIGNLVINECIDCSFHQVLNDPDPDDWFDDDDIKVICKSNDKSITTACRPYNIRKETSIPDWCPLLKLNIERK